MSMNSLTPYSISDLSCQCLRTKEPITLSGTKLRKYQSLPMLRGKPEVLDLLKNVCFYSPLTNLSGGVYK